jgi:hypothetical protein
MWFSNSLRARGRNADTTRYGVGNSSAESNIIAKMGEVGTGWSVKIFEARNPRLPCRATIGGGRREKEKNIAAKAKVEFGDGDGGTKREFSSRSSSGVSGDGEMRRLRYLLQGIDDEDIFVKTRLCWECSTKIIDTPPSTSSPGFSQWWSKKNSYTVTIPRYSTRQKQAMI